MPRRNSLLERLSSSKGHDFVDVYGSLENNAPERLPLLCEKKPRPWEDDHSNLEDKSMRQLALEFNLGVMFNTCLAIAVNISVGKENVLPFGLFGLLVSSIVYTVGKYVLHQAEKERATYEYEIERRHLEQYPLEETEELMEDLKNYGLSLQTCQAVIEDLHKNPHAQAQLHTVIHLGIVPHEVQILRECFISFFAYAMGCALVLFPFILIPDGIRASIGCILIMSVLSLASGAMLSLKASKSALFYAFRQLLFCLTATMTAVGFSILVQKYFYQN